MAADRHDAGMRITREAQGYVAGDGIHLGFGYWPGRGRPLVALHGLTASYVTFAGIAERLAGRRALLALDLRGRGRSDKPAEGYGMAQHAADVAAAMRAMGLGASVIVGHSMGAFVAIALAEQEPGLVAALVLLDGGYAPVMATPGSEALDAALTLRINQLRQTYPSREAYRQFWRTQPHFPPEVWGPWIEAFLDYEIDGEPPAFRPRASEQGVRTDLMEGLDRERMIQRCQRIRVPVLVLRASAGFVPGTPPLYPEAIVEQMRCCIPHMEEHLIVDSTHYTMVLGDHGATAVAGLIDAFTARCQPATEANPA
jgi:pimeloyl-ACP methyl ester carboxylesterase